VDHKNEKEKSEKRTVKKEAQKGANTPIFREEKTGMNHYITSGKLLRALREERGGGGSVMPCR